MRQVFIFDEVKYPRSAFMLDESTMKNTYDLYILMFSTHPLVQGVIKNVLEISLSNLPFLLISYFQGIIQENREIWTMFTYI